MNMGKTIIVTDKQLRFLLGYAKKDGKVFVKHLPHSSDFRAKKGSWKNTWIDIKGNNKWPTNSSKEMVACHVVDIETKKVYLYPKSRSENSEIIGDEDNVIFIADKELLVPFILSDATYVGPEGSPEEGLKKALSEISSL